MKKLTTLGVIVLIALFTNAQNNFNDFLNRINSLPENDRQAIADSFMNEASQVGIPYIEGDTAYFVYKGEGEMIFLSSGFVSWFPDELALKRIEGTNFFYHPKWFEQEARIEYKYVIDGTTWILDPANDLIGEGGMGNNSVLRMPEYDIPTEMDEYEETNKGSLTEITIHSSVLDRDYTTNIYLPYGYDASSTSYPVVYFQDGSDYLNYANAKNVLDNLIYDQAIDPVIGVFVTPTDRMEEYVFSEVAAYAQTFAEDIVNYVDANYRTIPNREKRLVIGDSDGAGISAYITFYYNSTFANVALQSIVAHCGDHFLSTNNGFQDIKIHYIHGIYEVPLWVECQTNYANDLAQTDHDFYYQSYPENHNFGFWGAHLDDAIIHFFPSGSTEIHKSASQSLMPVIIFPNPATNNITVSNSTDEHTNCTIKISDAFGNIVFSLKTVDTKKQIDISNFSNGIYFVSVNNGMNTKTTKLIKY